MAIGVSPQRLREVRFAEQWRGYRTDEVDEFVESVAEVFDQLEERLSEAVERAATAERRLLERGADDDLSRTLVLAQRTADAARREAEADAALARRQAEADAVRLVTEAEERSRTVLAATEARVAELEAAMEARAAAELRDLSERREALESDVDLLRAYVERQRNGLMEELRAHLAWLEKGLHLEQPPELQLPSLSGSERGTDEPPSAPPQVPVESTSAQPAPPEGPVALSDDAQADRSDGAEDPAQNDLGPLRPSDQQGSSQNRAGSPATGDLVRRDGARGRKSTPGDDGMPGDEILSKDEPSGDVPVGGVDAAVDHGAGPEAGAGRGDMADGDDEGGPNEGVPDDELTEVATSTEVAAPKEGARSNGGAQSNEEALLDQFDVGGLPWGEGIESPAGRAGTDAPYDDPFIAELRRAVDDPEPLGPRDEDDRWDGDVEIPNDDERPTSNPSRFRRGRRR